MPNTIIHKKSSTPGATPSAGSLSAGELAVNTADGVVYLKKDDGTVVPSAASLSHTHSAADITSGTISSARLGSGTASTATFLRGDGTWAAAGSTSASDLTSGTLSEDRLNHVPFHPFLFMGG